MNKESIKLLFKREHSFFMSVPAYVWIAVFFYVPLITIIARSFFVESCSSWLGCLSLQNYATLMAVSYATILLRSLVLAFGTACICLIIGYPVAYFIARKVGRYKFIFLFFIMLPFSVNLLVQAYAWFFVLGNTGLINTLLLSLGLISRPLSLLNTPMAVYIGMIYCYVPFMVLPLYAVIEKIDQRFIEASLDLGASWFNTFIRVILPLSVPGIRTGFLLVFIPVFGDFVIPALLGGSKQMYVGTLISHYFLTMRNLAIGSAFTCLSSVVVLVVASIIYWRLSKIRSC